MCDRRVERVLTRITAQFVYCRIEILSCEDILSHKLIKNVVTALAEFLLVKINREISVVRLDVLLRTAELHTLNTAEPAAVMFVNCLSRSYALAYTSEIAYSHSSSELVELGVAADTQDIVLFVDTEILELVQLFTVLLVVESYRTALYSVKDFCCMEAEH